MTRKRDVVRPYPPDYCSRVSLATRLDCSADSVDRLVRQGLLPPPLVIGTLKRWDWNEVDEAIKARNGKLDDFAELPNGDVHRIGDVDPFSAGVKRVTAANA
jgi:predicted DNA-binding transcriptional regulator AlpA